LPAFAPRDVSHNGRIRLNGYLATGSEGLYSVLGISIVGAQGLGDKLQFASFPENHFRNTGEKVIDVDRCWFFDHNPYVVRDAAPDRIVNLWTARYPAQSGLQTRQIVEKPVFFSLAERHCTILGHVAYLRHPRLYRFEDLPQIRNRVVLHTTGKNLPPVVEHGEDRQRVLPTEIIDFVRHTYRDHEILQIGARDDVDAHVTDCRGIEDLWEVARIVAQASIYIGVDSGPYWIAECFPRIFRKRVLVQYPPEFLRKSFVPMHTLNPNWHWHDFSCLYYNRSEDDAGVTFSYLKL